ncbi:hypothetical protein TSUD_219380 [Trifolium subterraneum]|uniref:Uncharacterized protein n=1 Tax=Trifolium subterraneum TaxID=3900 RepID=A0A2Z6MPP1_TRISU|nr:hypothetical protein TSUD_219380 [Trifolium subterraneum]
MYAETFDHNIEDKVVEIYPDGSESSSSDSERQIDVITGDESGENNSLDTHIKETKSLSSSASGRKSSSFSLSEISSDDLFGIDTLKFATSDAPAPKSEKNYVSSSDESSAKSEKNLSSNDFFGIDNLKFTASNASEPAPKSGKNYVSSSDESSSNSETNNRPPVPTSTYQVYNVAYSPKCMSPTLSPSIQVMDRSGGYDSSRIPSSIFEINSNINPLEWSLASNDSLFSIHIDQNSFSKDTFKFRESQRSEKLTKPVEQNTFNQIPSVTIEKIDISNKIDDIENLEPLEESFRFKPHLTEVQHDIKSLHEIVNSMSTKSSAMSSFENETMRHSFVPL